MPCQHVTLPGGQHAIVCGKGGGRKCVKCKRPATQLCDWKVDGKKSGTCDTPICKRCSHQPAPNKDLCPAHSAEWKAMREARRAANENGEP